MDRCEGMIKKGSFMTFGPRGWKQCESNATVMVKFKSTQEGNKKNKIEALPACNSCWQKCLESNDIKIIDVKPILQQALNGA